YDGMSPRRLVEITGVVGTGGALARGFLQNTVALHGSEPLSGIRILVSPVLDLLGVRYVLMAPGAAPPRPGLALVYDAADARIFRNDGGPSDARVAREPHASRRGGAVRRARGRVHLRAEVAPDRGAHLGRRPRPRGARDDPRMASPVKTLATAAILALAAAPASAALPAPPFDFSLSPAAVTEGAPATVRIAPVRAPSAGAPETYD